MLSHLVGFDRKTTRLYRIVFSPTTMDTDAASSASGAQSGDDKTFALGAVAGTSHLGLMTNFIAEPES